MISLKDLEFIERNQNRSMTNEKKDVGVTVIKNGRGGAKSRSDRL